MVNKSIDEGLEPIQNRKKFIEKIAPEKQILECLSTKMTEYVLLTDAKSHSIFTDILAYQTDIEK